MEGDEVERRAKKWLKFRILMKEMLVKEFIFKLRKQLANRNKKGTTLLQSLMINVEKNGFEPSTS